MKDKITEIKQEMDLDRRDLGAKLASLAGDIARAQERLSEGRTPYALLNSRMIPAIDRLIVKIDAAEKIIEILERGEKPCQ
jgi:hypothetical protein